MGGCDSIQNFLWYSTPYGARPNNRQTYVPGGSKLAMDRSGESCSMLNCLYARHMYTAQ